MLSVREDEALRATILWVLEFYGNKSWLKLN